MAKAPPKLSGLIKDGHFKAPVEPGSLPPFHPAVPSTESTQATVATKSEEQDRSSVGATEEVKTAPPGLQQVHSTDQGSYTSIDPQLIDPNPFAPRQIYPDEVVLRRAEELRIEQREAIHVIPNPDAQGRYIIADGWTRVLSCVKYAARPTLRAEIHLDLSVQEAAWFGYAQNEQREQHCDFDRAMFFEKLIAEGSPISDVIARSNISKTVMTMYRAFGKLPSEVIEIIKGKPQKFSYRAAYELGRISESAGARKTVAVALKFNDEDQPIRWLVNQTQAVLHPSPHKVSGSLKHIRYSNGYYKQKGESFEMSVQVQPERMEQFSAALEALLDTVAIKASPDSAGIAPISDSPGDEQADGQAGTRSRTP